MSLDITPHIDLYDTDILAIEKGPLEWMKSKQFERMDLEDFRRTTQERFEQIGFRVNVKCYDTDQADVYAFDVEILGRTNQKSFDYDRMTHEVVNNVLALPDQAGGWVDTDKAMMEMLKKEREHGKHKH